MTKAIEQVLPAVDVKVEAERKLVSQVDEQATKINHLVAIDLGSNSFHFIIAREQDGCLQILDRQKQSIGLAAGLDENNCLSKAAIAKAITCLREFNLSLTNLPSSAIRIVATHALRNASNIDDFKQQANLVLPHPIEVISGKREAELIFKGVAHTQPLRGTTFIIDIGGGSSELVIGNNFTTSLADSLSMGCISFQQQFFATGEINTAAMHDAQAFAKAQLTSVADRYRELDSKTVLGTSGSIKTISLVMLELYGDNKITAKRLNRLVKQLIRWQHHQNIPLHSIEAARRPLLAGAVAILSTCFSQLGITQMKFSLGGLREGVLYDLSQSRTDIDTRERTIQNLMRLYHVDKAFNQGVLQQVAFISQQLQTAKGRLSRGELALLCWAAKLHEIGIAINSKKRQRHGAYIIEHSDMPGFNSKEKQLIALLVTNHRGKIKLAGDEASLLGISNARIHLLIQILRLAIILTQGRLQVSKPAVTATPIVVTYLLSAGKPSLKITLKDKIGLAKKLALESQKQSSAGITLTLVFNTAKGNRRNT